MESARIISIAGYSRRGAWLSLTLAMLLGLPALAFIAIRIHGGPLAASELPAWGLGALVTIGMVALIHQIWLRRPRVESGAAAVWIGKDRLHVRAPWPGSVRLDEIADVEIADAPTRAFKTNQTLTVTRQNGSRLQMHSVYLDLPLSKVRTRILAARPRA